MLGAIIGDIVGSVYEWHNIKTKDFPLFRDDCFFTDDTVMTCAVADAIMNGGERDNFIDSMKKYGRMYPDAGYGGNFGTWIFSDNREPYNSFGSGSAMRVSPCGWMMDCGFTARTGMWPSNGREEKDWFSLFMTESGVDAFKRFITNFKLLPFVFGEDYRVISLANSDLANGEYIPVSINEPEFPTDFDRYVKNNLYAIEKRSCEIG